MWLTCQVERVSATLAITIAGLFVHPCLRDGRPLPIAVVAGDVGDELDSLRWLPTTSTAWVRQVWRCSASERGSCLDLPGLQGGLLGKSQHFHDAGFAAVLGLEPLGQLADTVLDRGPPRGESVGQFGGDTDDFTHRTLAEFGVGGVGEHHAGALDQQRFEAGVVQLGGGDGGLV